MKQGWALLLAVFLYFAGGVGEQLSVPEIKNYIYGNIGHPVKIYVKMHQNSPFLVCMDMELSQTEIVDPISLWMGPNGKHLKEGNHINLTSVGKLMITNFQESLSGSYICTLTYKIISEETQKEQELFNIYIFMVFGYQEPDYAYQMTVRFTTDSCNGKKNSQFFKLLMRILDEIIFDLTCHIEEPSYKCHFLEIPKYGLKEELFIAFQVRPFLPEQKAACRKLSVDCEEITNSKVHQARDRIEEFFVKQTDILKREFYYIPDIRYVDHSFKVIRIDSCQPGFGKNDILHSDCASCCVVCDPRTYSPDTDVTCQACLTIRNYGAKICP
ncbi:zona pellucida-binding protein 2 [Trichosurus vulpecula]|uniref:zona pellucida-binding protein 2 n=1 Tax=Trichosurus vulpecula TaxID=9337 RepID=UPI00186B3BF2|nr:zona pellucida-binding protein 2 [Trichosurus vulpecula]